MRYRDLSNKEIVNVKSGSRLGVLGQTDLEINEQTGHIESFIVSNYSWFGMKREGNSSRIHWDQIKKIGDDMVIIES
ncbi:YlmC/YmxH family sporulation protein [Aquibacillus salsiterrae]|uniref:YlmC/YmxH family sporulation protein n=1 Tax=Aquibacillus salsiterrae TaxID=2950439 RepID=A0A9X4AE61_9BACI|nr:YlmC/YmxH family sporulation protein [Aquibacillus salsiterrae]MDC3416351.1 YlmC/YmxH family sporulation protein [Aquibacillus salsiterrae]